MVEELFVVSITRNQYSGHRGMFLNKDQAITHAEQSAVDPEVTYVEVRVYDTLDLINYALDDLADAAEEDPEVENGELVATFE